MDKIMQITITLINGKHLINGKQYKDCNDTENRCFNETILATKLTGKVEFELTINNYK